MEWTETESRGEAQGENKDIVLTLNKVKKPLPHLPPPLLL